MRIYTTVLFAGALLVVVAVCVYILCGLSKVSAGLALSATSACIAVYSAWQMNLREAAPRFVGIIKADGRSSKRTLLFYNVGAIETCVSSVCVVSRRSETSTYEIPTDLYCLRGHEFLRIPITRIQRGADLADEIELRYTYYVGARRVEKRRHLCWEVDTNERGAEALPIGR